MKTNQAIMKELTERGRFKSPKEVEEFFLKALEEKDAQSKQIQEKILQYFELQNDSLKKEMIELKNFINELKGTQTINKVV